MAKIWVNGFGWVMGGNPETGLKFTKQKAGAKPFDEMGKELLNVRIYIEQKMQSHYDLWLE